MSAPPPDATRASSKKRKHNDDGETSTGPAKKSKSHDNTRRKKVDEVPSRTYDASKSVDQYSTHEASKPKHRKRKPRRGKPEPETKRDHHGPTIEENTPAKIDWKTVSRKEEGKDRKAERKAERRARKKRGRELKRVSNDIPDENVNAKPASDSQALGEAETQRRKERAAAKKARTAAAKEQNHDSKALVRQDRRIVKGTAKDVPSFRNWTLSPPSAGRFLDHDPIFVQDEKGDDFLISANSREVQVLSLEASLVVRTHPAPAGKSVVCFAIDARSDGIVHIGCSDGFVANWDWTKDSEPKEGFTLEGDVKALASAPCRGDDETALFYLSKMGGQYAIFNHDDNLLLYATKRRLDSIQILGNGDYIVSHGPSALVLGMKKGSLTDFIWIEVPLTTPSTCLDARLVPFHTGSKKTAGRHSGLSLALGNSNGQIHLYDEISSVFFLPGQLQPNNMSILPTSRILHWHREAVSSVKFSQDGNYLISGGKETVLVIWQLETGKKQFLPHLGSEIDRVVVSEKGDRYAVQMGDNSIMVLSTSELKAVAVFAALHMMSSRSTLLEGKESGFVGTLHPQHPQQLLLAVPSSQPKSEKDLTSRPFLQTFDIRHSRHISRQALTRNNVTDFNLGPERTPIIPPDVAHLAISADGMWLATVDQWMPPSSDLEHLDATGVGVENERERRREVYLKIWHRDEVQGIWTLSTRIDAPHARESREGGEGMGAGRVLGLVADPASNEFATAGEDRCVKLWTPRRRRRDEGVVEWRCKWVVQLPRGGEAQMEEGLDGEWGVEGACLAFSADGSLLATALTHRASTTEEASVVHFINTSTGTVVTSKSGSAKHAIQALGFLERYFIAVSHPAAYVWDLVEDTLMYKISLSSSGTPGAKRPILAIDHDDNTFALVIDGRRVEVHNPRRPQCLYKQEFGTEVEGILSGKGRRGFAVVFADATLRTISPSGASSKLRSLPGGEGGQLARAAPPSTTVQPLEFDPAADEDEMTDLTASSTKMLKDTNSTSIVSGRDEEDDRPVVRPEQLANIFDVGPSFAMPPVKDMFQAVVGLFGRKPVQSGVPQG